MRIIGHWLHNIGIAITILLGLCCQRGQAKIFNVDASSSYAAKILAGTRQGSQWIYDSMFVPDVGREPRTMQVAFVGLGRTGTTSFVVALKKLGYSPAHDDQIAENVDVLRGMLDGTMPFDEAQKQLGWRGFDAAVITIHEYIKWVATQPDMKIILTVRDTKRWASSFSSIARAAFLA